MGRSASLRERKKEKTRALIQSVALRLFTERGYDATSVEEVAEAADVSLRTIYRYFPSKADLVFYAVNEQPMVEAIRDQPSDLSAVQAIRAAVRAMVGGLSREALDIQEKREWLARSVPELRTAMLGEMLHTLARVAAVLAERSGPAADDPEVLALAGAVQGIVMTLALGGPVGAWRVDVVDWLDRSLALLETGFRL